MFAEEATGRGTCCRWTADLPKPQDRLNFSIPLLKKRKARTVLENEKLRYRRDEAISSYLPNRNRLLTTASFISGSFQSGDNYAYATVDAGGKLLDYSAAHSFIPGGKLSIQRTSALRSAANSPKDYFKDIISNTKKTIKTMIIYVSATTSATPAM